MTYYAKPCCDQCGTNGLISAGLQTTESSPNRHKKDLLSPITTDNEDDEILPEVDTFAPFSERERVWKPTSSETNHIG